ncbi:hypothetical protein ACFWAY_31370 [Rhodococcus sp. NPDC059968]|uniref:hypothetical protein n=1 Tax=Rhodococcus sp. NPDC059968 TaxID=3347017 RepID=UPI00366EE7CD
MVDPVWAGVIGGAIGGFFTSAVSLLGPRVNWGIESRKLDKLHETEMSKTRQEHRRAMVAEWRIGIHEEHEKRVQKERDRGSGPSYLESLSGLRWFESLRPRLTIEANAINEISWSFEDSDKVEELSAEVARIEKEWGLV